MRIFSFHSQGLRKYVTAAVLVLAAYICSNVLWIFYTEHDVISHVKNCINEWNWKSNGAVAATGSDSDERTVLTFTITDWDEIHKAKKLLKELYIPYYIPDGYEFYELKMEYSELLSYMVTYKFVDENTGNLLLIDQDSVEDSENVLLATSDVYLRTVCDLGTLYLTYNDALEIRGGIIPKDHEQIYFRCKLSEDEIIKIADGCNNHT